MGCSPRGMDCFKVGDGGMDGGGEQGNEEGEGRVSSRPTTQAPPCLVLFHLPGILILWNNIYLMTIYDGI